MPGPQELIGILVAIFVIWFVLKLAKVAIKFIILLIALLAVAGLVYYLFMR
ncbi:MAG TPA: hypothetical protein VJZ76_17160 [Thermoanaerobaculia bacterium]|nr:hypothetical protein [Thermoanaerobaculia bacterium]